MGVADSPAVAPTSISLTFDDGPDPVWTPRILSALREAEAPATFFVCAPAVRRHPGLARRIAEEGHEVALHCDRHVRHSEQTHEEVDRDTDRALAALEDAGIRPCLWRSPWGDLAPFSEDVAERHDLRLVGWNSDTHDWRGDSAAEMLRSVGPEISSGSIVLMHDGLGPGAQRPGCGETEALIGPLVELARGRGLEPRPLGALLEPSPRVAEPA